MQDIKLRGAKITENLYKFKIAQENKHKQDTKNEEKKNAGDSKVVRFCTKNEYDLRFLREFYSHSRKPIIKAICHWFKEIEK